MTEDAGVLENNRQKTVTKDTQKQNYSLVEVAQKTGIPMPILLRYKREHPDSVPSIGSGSQQRFPEEAIEVLTQIHQEATGREEEPRRGGFGLLSLPRLRKQVRRPDEDEEEEEAAEAKPAKRGRASTGAATGEGMTLVEVSEKLDIPYPTVARYASQHGDRIPHHGSGRSRRFPEAALEVFEQIRKESKPGRPPKKKAKAKREAAGAAGRATGAASASSGATPGLEQLSRRIESLERSQKMLEDQIRDLLDDLARPAKATVEV